MNADGVSKLNMSKPLVIVARQRTGTSSLHRALVNSGLFETYREIFYELDESTIISSDVNESKIRDFNFLNWLKKSGFKSSDSQLSNGEWFYILDEYFQDLSRQEDKEYCIVDVKYNQLNVINQIDESEPPVFLQYLCSRSYPVIHLVRDNFFSCFVSGEYMNKVGKGLYRQGESAVSGISMQIDPEYCFNDMKQYEEMVNRVEGVLSGCKNYLRQSYESLYRNNEVSRSVVKAVRNLLAEDRIERLVTDYIKTPVNYGDVIDNCAELKRFFSGTKYADMVEEYLS